MRRRGPATTAHSARPMLGSCNLVPSRLRAPAATPSTGVAARVCCVAYLAEPSAALHVKSSQCKAHRQTKDTQPPTPTSTSTSTPAPTLHPPFPWSAIAPAPAPSLTTDPSAEPNCCLSHGLTRVVYSFDHKETSALLPSLSPSPCPSPSHPHPPLAQSRDQDQDQQQPATARSRAKAPVAIDRTHTAERPNADAS